MTATVSKSIRKPVPVNEQARALFHRAGTANVAIAVDTRPKRLRNRKAYTRKGRTAAIPHF